MRRLGWVVGVVGVWSLLGCGGLLDEAEREAVEIIIKQDLPSTPPDGGMTDAVVATVTELPEDFPLSLSDAWKPEMVLETGKATMVALKGSGTLDDALTEVTAALAAKGCDSPVRGERPRQVTLQCRGVDGWKTLSANVGGDDGALSVQVSYAPADPAPPAEAP